MGISNTKNNLLGNYIHRPQASSRWPWVQVARFDSAVHELMPLLGAQGNQLCRLVFEGREMHGEMGP